MIKFQIDGGRIEILFHIDHIVSRLMYIDLAIFFAYPNNSSVSWSYRRNSYDHNI